jgi:hypothetical protein
MEFPQINDPFYRESLRPLKPTAQQLRDKRYHATVEAIHGVRAGESSLIMAPMRLPRDGAIRVPVILGQPGDPNRHHPRPIREDVHEEEYSEFRRYAQQFLDLQLRIEQIRGRSAIYPIWAGDTPSVPAAISRKFVELNQQLFALKKCFVSPEEIMLDNTAMVIQRFWRSVAQRRIFMLAAKSIHSYHMRELSSVHRTLNSWIAQMEYADSRAQQLCFKSISRVSKLSLRFWQKWSERESVITNRNEGRALEQLGRSREHRHRRLLQLWRDIAMGPRSWKALRDWRQSMIPVMKRELENQGVAIPLAYTELVSAYVAIRAHRSFLFNVFLAWNSKVHSKSLRQTVIERNAFLFHKRKLTSMSLRLWTSRVRKTKAFLQTPERWARYIGLARARHKAKLARIRVIVEKWHVHARNQTLLRQRLLHCRTTLLHAVFGGWQKIVERNRGLKLKAIMAWKRTIQDPKVIAFRGWRLWALKKHARRRVRNELDESHITWQCRRTMDRAFGTWQRRLAESVNHNVETDLEHKRWRLEQTKQETQLLSVLYSRDRDRITDIENRLIGVTSGFVATEDEVSRLEELCTTWKIALHAMKLEYMRLALIVEKCSTSVQPRRRRFSNEDWHDRVAGDDRYGNEGQTRLSMMQVSDRVIGKWERRNSDPDLSDDLKMVHVKPPLDEAIISLVPKLDLPLRSSRSDLVEYMSKSHI